MPKQSVRTTTPTEAMLLELATYRPEQRATVRMGMAIAEAVRVRNAVATALARDKIAALRALATHKEQS